MVGRKKRSEVMTETKPLHETDEFKAAVAKATAEAVAAAIPSILSQLTKARGPDTPISANEQSWAEGLAMAIAQLNDQGSGRKRVAPEVVKAREEARVEMTRLIVAAKAEGVIPLYQLRNKVYLDEILIEPVYIDMATKSPRPTEIGWPSVPSEAMIPINDAAKGIYEMFSKSIGSTDWQKKPDTFGITAGGLVVKNGAVQPKRALPSDNGNINTEGLTINKGGRGGNQNYKEIPILGTVAAPARQAV
jgi:hypothetical protein